MSRSTSCTAHRNGKDEQEQVATVAGTGKPGRDGNGRFTKGNAGGPGNPFNRQVAALRQQLVDALTPERMARVIEAVMQKAEAGDLAAAKLLWQYGMGKPALAVQPDRMDVEELALYQEQQLSPEAWVQIIKSIPAGMACQMLRPIMPILNQSAAKGIQQMALESGIVVSQPAPSPTVDNGEEAPIETGLIGEPEPMVKQRTHVSGANRGQGQAEPARQCVARQEPGNEYVEGKPPAPSLTGDNGQQAPMVTGFIGGRAPMGNGGNGRQEPRVNGGSGQG